MSRELILAPVWLGLIVWTIQSDYAPLPIALAILLSFATDSRERTA